MPVSFLGAHPQNATAFPLLSTTAPYDPTVVFLLGASVVELLVCVMSVPFSAINLVIIGRTSLLHPNLKMILLSQSAFILMRTIVRSLINAHKMASMDPYSAEMMEPYRLFHVFAFFNRNFIAHVLIIERTMATAMVKTYEARKGWLFTFAWCLLAFSVSFFNTIELGQLFATFASVVTESAMLFVGLGEWVVFARLWHYNEQRYKRSISQSGHSLSERFQLSENIRTGKQLTPTLSFHFLMLFTSALTGYWSYFELPAFDQVYMGLNVANGIAGLIIETLMITCHPFLKRDALFTIQRIFVLQLATNRVHDKTAAQQQQATMKCARKSLAMCDLINGTALTVSSGRQDSHFDSLRKCWEEGAK